MIGRDPAQQILILDPDVSSAGPLCRYLQAQGFSVHVKSDARFDADLGAGVPRLILIDWDAFGVRALEIMHHAREARLGPPTRVVILSELALESDIVAGLALGADDYIAKPYSIGEVGARVRALLRVRKNDGKARTRLQFGGLSLDLSSHQIAVGGKFLDLRGAEYRLLEFLMMHAEQAFSRGRLLVEVWGSGAQVDQRTVDVNVRRLRQLLALPGYEDYIQTVRGVGYRFGVPSHSAHR